MAEQSDPRSELRQLRDPTELRALAHPTRLALLELLGLYGPLTATQAAEHLEESPSSLSFHLRTLAKHGFVTDAGGGTGRQRPWQLVTRGTSIDPDAGDAETRTAARELSDIYLERYLDRARAAFAHRDQLPAAWRRATTFSQSLMWLTAAEARALDDAVMGVLMQYRDRLDDPSARPASAKPVEALHLMWRRDVL